MRSGKATFGENGIITKPDDVGGWPELESEPAPADSDHDGMSDAWEKEHGLKPNDASDGVKDRDGGGYTNLEERSTDWQRPAILKRLERNRLQNKTSNQNENDND